MLLTTVIYGIATREPINISRVLKESKTHYGTNKELNISLDCRDRKVCCLG